MKIQKIILLIVLFSFSMKSYSQILHNDVGYIPSDCQIDWRVAGLLPNTPSAADNIYNIDDESGNDDERIASALLKAKNASGTSIIYFPSRNYCFTKPINLKYHSDPTKNGSNIIFQGEGPDQTILNFTVTRDSACFNIIGQTSGSTLDLYDDVIMKTKSLRGSLGTLSVGNWIHLCEYSFDDNYSGNGYVGQINRIESVIPIGFDMTYEASKTYLEENDLWVQKILPITNVGIENLKILRLDTQKSQCYHYGEGNNINFNYAVNCWVKGIEMEYSCRHHIVVSRSSHIEFSGCYIHHARGYGSESYGNGTVLGASTTNCLIENNIFKHLRHAMMVGQGANSNVIIYNFSTEQIARFHATDPCEEGTDYPDSDLCLHGRYPYSNLFEHNSVEFIEADDTHGLNGPYNVFFRNCVYDYHKLNILDEIGWGEIDLYYSPNTAVLGSEIKFNGVSLICRDDGEPDERTSFSIEGYGIISSVLVSYSVLDIYMALTSTLDDVSYYYSSIPDFVLDSPGSVSFPSIGPEAPLYGDPTTTNHDIPAGNRNDTNDKIYLPDPTAKALTTSGSLPYSQTWSGTHTLTGDITIPSGMTLTIEPGTFVSIPSGKKITVQGTLAAEGTSSEHITFDKSGSSNWYGIRFEDSSIDYECNLEYCNIQNASYGVYCYKASPDIKNCTINNNFFGIYASYGTSSHQIWNNNIANNFYGVGIVNTNSLQFYINNVHDNTSLNFYCSNVPITSYIDGNEIHHCSSGNGVNLYSSHPYLIDNDIYDNYGYGIYCNNSSPELMHYFPLFSGDNVIAYNGNYGIYIDTQSHPTLGTAPYNHDPVGQNSYYSNHPSYDVYSLNSSTISAGNCYWGGGNPKTTENVEGMWEILYDDPNEDPHGLQKAIASVPETINPEPIAEYEINENARHHYNLGYDLEQKENYDAALERYKFVISNYPETLEAEMSLTRILICYNKTKRSEVALSYMETLVTEKADFRVGGKALGHLTRQLVQDGEYKKALINCESQAQKFADSDISKDALFTKWQIYFDGLKEEDNAISAMNEFESSFPNDHFLAHMKIALGEWTPEMEEQFLENLPKRFDEQPEQAAPVEIPEKFTLSGNYPNPFNPETTIIFGVPEESRVTIEIFNVLGQKVARLLESEKPAGYHSVRWDGRNEFGKKVGAGVYMCRMQAGDFIETQKMMLLP